MKNLPQWEDFPPEVLKDEYRSVSVEDIFIAKIATAISKD
ncbi:hypothetical protein CIP106467_1499 [Citrobacter europaeus]|nr:hypothetical protein CIP106467_1499 [Citrobacter europaeus]